MMLLTLAALIPPPPGWTPPQASGPGTFCGRTFTLGLQQGETISARWPGEVFINDVYGTYDIDTGAGRVTVSEDGARARPTGSSRRAAAGFRSYGSNTYVLRIARHELVKAVTVRFAAGTPRPAADALLSRIRAGVATTTQCLRPTEG